MTLKYRDKASYVKYDMIVNHVLMMIGFQLGAIKLKSMSWKNYDLRTTYKELNLKVTRADSVPTGGMGAKSMLIEFKHYNEPIFGQTSWFGIKFDQTSNTVGFKTNKEYDHNFEHCQFIKQSDDMSVILEHISKVFYQTSLKNKLISKLGYEVSYDEFSYDHINVMQMIRI